MSGFATLQGVWLARRKIDSHDLITIELTTKGPGDIAILTEPGNGVFIPRHAIH